MFRKLPRNNDNKQQRRVPRRWKWSAVVVAALGFGVATLIAQSAPQADTPPGGGACSLPIANCTTEEQPPSEETPPPEPSPAPSPDTSQGEQPSQTAPPQGETPSDAGQQDAPIKPQPLTPEQEAENALLEAIQGGKSIGAEVIKITDCPPKGKPKPGTDCYTAHSFASRVTRRLDQELGGHGSPVPSVTFAGGAALLAGLHDNSNSKPPTWAFPSVHAALPVLLKLAEWGANRVDEAKAQDADTAARRLLNLLVRNDLEARKLQ